MSYALVGSIRRLSNASPELTAVLHRWKGGEILLQTDKKHPKVARIVLNRPDKNNCLSGEMIIQMRTIVEELEAEKHKYGVVVLDGNGKSFCSGADLGLINELCSPSLGNAMFGYMSDTLTALRHLPAVVVGKLHGHTLGGATEIASACDIRIAHKKTKIGFLQARMGIVPSWGGASWLPSIVGRSTALRLMTSAPIISADEAKCFGFVDEVFDADEDAEAFITSLAHFDVSVIQGQKAMLAAVDVGKTAEEGVIKSVWGGDAQLKAVKKQLDTVVTKKGK